MRADATEAVPVDAFADSDPDDIDLSFAGPEPVAAAAWPSRLLDVASAYLPLVLMALLAAATWWLVQVGPAAEPAAAPPPPRHEPDYVMTNFAIQRYASDGALRTQIEGRTLRHYPDTDTLEVDDARIRSHDRNGVVSVATAQRALSNGDGSEVQLLGGARVLRPAVGKQAAVEFRGEFFAGFRNLEQVRSPQPVVVTQGAGVVEAEGMVYDHLAQTIELHGRVDATLVQTARGR